MNTTLNTKTTLVGMITPLLSTSRKFLFALLIGGLSASLWASNNNTPAPLYDLTKNPGCGVTGLSKEEKIARNIRLIEYYFQYWTVGEENVPYVWETYNCYAETHTLEIPVLSSTTAEPITIPRRPLPENMNDHFIVKEKKAYSTLGPHGHGAVPGSLSIHAQENGATFTLAYGGLLDSGEWHQFWEVAILEINDAGEITHLEFWHEKPAVYKTVSLLTGTPIDKLDYKTYGAAIHAAAAKKDSQ